MGGAKVDANAVMAGYEKTGNAAQVARDLRIHENTARQIIRKRLGKCVRCGEANIDMGKTMCGPCLERDRDRMKNRRANRLRNGLCTECGEPRSRLSRNLCERHRIEAAERHETSRKRIKGRGAPNNGIQDGRQRRQTILERYGEGGLAAWSHYNGCCAACSESYTDVAVHLHHIDENPQNNARENFTCLCFRCHRAVHLLLSSKNRKSLIRIFEAMYPDKPLR